MNALMATIFDGRAARRSQGRSARWAARTARVARGDRRSTGPASRRLTSSHLSQTCVTAGTRAARTATRGAAEAIDRFQITTTSGRRARSARRTAR